MTAVETHAVAVPSLPGPVKKMEDQAHPHRKRPAAAAHERDDQPPPAKRQATSAVNGARPHPDQDMPWRNDLEEFTKDAILRQMAEYKRQLKDTKAEMEDLNRKMVYHDDHIRAINAWFSQVIDEVKVIVGEAVADMSESETELDRFPTSLLFENREKFESYLSSHSSAIKSAIAALYSKIPKADPSVRRLQEELVRLSAEKNERAAEVQRLTMERDDLSDRLEGATSRYMVAEKKLDRAKSTAVAKLERQALGNSISVASRNGEESSSAVKREGSDANGVTVDGGALESAMLAKKEAESTSVKRKEQIETLEEENKSLRDLVAKLEGKWASLTDEDYAKTELFKLAKSQLKEFIERITSLEATNTQLREEAQKLQAERTEHHIKMDEEQHAAIAEMENQLARLEMDLARVRQQRDEYAADIDVRKKTAEEKKRAFEQTEELLASRQHQIEALQEKVQRYEISAGEVTVQDSGDLDSVSPEELRSKVRTTRKEFDLLNQELSAMESAYKRSQALASKKVSDTAAADEAISRLSAEKAKADQKYFAAMKAKEARENENRALRAQNAKSSEIISSLKDGDKSSLQLVANLERSRSELNDVISGLKGEQRSLQARVTELSSAQESATNTMTELKKLLNTKEASISSSGKEKREVEVENEQLKVELAETKRSLEGWKKKGLGSQTSEYESLRRIALCNCCQRNFKNTVIKNCGHVLCLDCVEERIQSRSRKCPNCGRSFGTSDYMRVTL
ncbi:C3HC4 type zinc finger-containing protein [Lineolata rhizophorae]|uniref:E3 ubiquitin protein ligase n=1 Tax=Lineolata rhizophorae TaxID=578093 RepID=A0A6A6P0J0_9PEZI|nr:C3HC4 type zinc finger-containing protein [Lineolata rhizophorae]